MSREDVILKEYEVCQSHNNALGNQSWISTSILLTVNLLLLGQVVAQVILTSTPGNVCARFWIVLPLAAAMIVISCIFKRWHARVTFQVWLNNERMREIEARFGMWKNWRVRGLDLLHEGKWGKLPLRVRPYISELSQRYHEKVWKRASTVGVLKYQCVFPIMMCLWVLVVILHLVMLLCEGVSKSLLT